MTKCVRFGVLLTMLACVGLTSASVISMSVITDPAINSVSEELSGTNFTAGVVPVAYWNDSVIGSGGWLPLRDDAGTWTTASLQIWYTTNYAGASPAFANAGDTRMMSGHIYNPAGSATSLSFADIPYAEYDVYVYYNSGALDSNVQTIAIDGTAFSALASEMSTNADSAVVLSDGTNDANYVKFSNVTLSDITIRLSAASGYSYYNAVQIVAVPEPATLALLSLGGLFLRRVKR